MIYIFVFKKVAISYSFNKHIANYDKNVKNVYSYLILMLIVYRWFWFNRFIEKRYDDMPSVITFILILKLKMY